MYRVMKKTVGRFEAGHVYGDYSITTWKQIAKGLKLDDISRPALQDEIEAKSVKEEKGGKGNR